MANDSDLGLHHDGSINSTLFGLDKIDAKVHVPETVKSDATVHVPETVKSDATVHVPETVTTDSTVDVKPMAVDTCVRVVLGAVPPTRVHSPWEQRVSLSLLGVELWSVALTGELRTYVDPMSEQPVVVGAIDEPRDRPAGARGHEHDQRSAYDGPSHGLEIRLG